MVIHLPERPPGAPRYAFTLVEMVIVIAVLVILLISGATLLRGTGPQARKAASDLIYAMVDQARTTAITTRSHVILAIAEPGDLPAGDERCRIGLFKIDAWPDSPSDPIPAVLLSRWKMIETGVALLPGDIDGVPNPLDAGELTLEYGAASQSVNVHAIVFHPRGGLRYPDGSTPVVLRLAEGAYRDGAPVPVRASTASGVIENRIKIGRVSARPYRFD